MSSHHEHILDDRFIYELTILRTVLEEKPLDDVVPVEVLDEFNDIWLQPTYQEVQLMRVGQALDHFL